MDATHCPRETLHLALTVLARNGIRQPHKQLPKLQDWLGSAHQPPNWNDLVALLRQAQDLTGNPALMLEFGMLLGLQHGLETPQRLPRSSPLEQLWRFEIQAQTVQWHWRLAVNDPCGLTELLLAYTHSRYPISRDHDQLVLHLPFAKPAHAHLYALYIPLPIEFASDNLALSNTAPFWPWQMQLGTEALPSSNTAANAPLTPARVVVEKTLNALRANLTNPPLQQHIAQRLLLSERTFKRRLQDCQCCYQELLSDLRLRLACQWLNQGQLSVSDIAQRLGYANVANFSKAFKKWKGCAPSRWHSQSVSAPIAVEKAKEESELNSQSSVTDEQLLPAMQ
ncbi:hypothetical protein GCM10011297_03030 [Bacterioplanes sanyensis]|uniref:helix-turn-helix transcriptional regulator n=1 Tax=Bacterioplanes sanyensis TaxID=1249553 RepID=UPI00167BC6C2|nr:helix-turn-helix transcriptional regulator [Bacterioplanes sanyensis]GGY33455.1 hypothetical protein GCM10011297_03030 [Bacterioplanes sanyensis]